MKLKAQGWQAGLGWGVGWIVFFDGECALCSRVVRVLARLDRREVLRFAPLRGETAAAMGVAVPAGEDGSIVVVRADGGRFERGEAVLELARALGGPWRLALAGRVVPRRWRDGIYDFVARRRYRWFGRAGCCSLSSGVLLP